jgi:hypothetical protein
MTLFGFDPTDPRKARAFDALEALDRSWADAAPPPPGFASALAHPMAQAAQTIANEGVAGLQAWVLAFSRLDHWKDKPPYHEAAPAFWRQVGSSIAAIKSLGLSAPEADALATRAFSKAAMEALTAIEPLAPDSRANANERKSRPLARLDALFCLAAGESNHVPSAGILMELIVGNFGAWRFDESLKGSSRLFGEDRSRSPSGFSSPQIPIVDWAGEALAVARNHLDELQNAPCCPTVARRLSAMARLFDAAQPRPGESDQDDFSSYASQARSRLEPLLAWVEKIELQNCSPDIASKLASRAAPKDGPRVHAL